MITTIEIDGLIFTGHEDGEITIERVNKSRNNFAIGIQHRKSFDTFLSKVQGDFSKTAATAVKKPARTAVQSVTARVNTEAKPRSNNEVLPKRIAKEEQGWGIDVKLDSGDVVRYFYEKRDQARVGESSDTIGKRGRIL